mgnify:CR=1 FL=1
MEYQIIEDSNLKLKIIKNNKTNSVDPMLELYKGKLFSFLIKNFTNDCIDNFGTHIFSIKKSYNRTIINILSSWMFSLYINYDYSSDYFFPTNYTNTDYLESTLNDLCKYDEKITNQEDKIKRIITNLKINYRNSLKILDEYKNSYNYKNNKNNYRIKKIMTNIKKNKSSEKEITFYKFEIIIGFIIKDNVGVPFYTYQSNKQCCANSIEGLPWLMRIEFDKEKLKKDN